MKKSLTRLHSVLFFTLAVAQIGHAQTTMFTYQGRLEDNGTPANGIYEMQFGVFDQSSGGSQQGSTNITYALSVSNGLFMVALDFGNAVFDGTERWLNIGVRPGGSSMAFANVVPRRQISATPYAIRAANFSGAVSDSQLSANIARLSGANQTFSAPVNFSNPLNSYTGTFSGNGVGLTNVPGAIPSQIVSGTSVQTQPNSAYDVTGSTPVVVALPYNANIGDVVRINGTGAGGWRVEPGTGQYLNGVPPGVHWTPRDSIRFWRSVASSADGSKLVAIEFEGQIYTSADYGANWTPRESSRNWASVASSADGIKLVAVESGGQIYTSIDAGASWTPRDSNRNWSSVTSSADGTKLVAAVQTGQIYTSTDSGASWIARDVNRGWVSVASSADGSRLVAAVLQGPIFTSTDSGVTWIDRGHNDGWLSVASSADGTKLLGAVLNGYLYTSTDGGATWVARDNYRNWTCVASSADGSNLVAVVDSFGLVGGAGQIYTSTDRGTNWTARESNRAWSSVASSADGTRLVATDGNGRIYTSIPVLVGDQGSMVELQYAGNGVWQPLNSGYSVNRPNTPVSRDVNGSFSANEISWGTGGLLSASNGGSIELGDSRQSGLTPFIDFHYGTGVAQDYNVRLINNANGALSLFGNLYSPGSNSFGNVGINPSAELSFGSATRQMVNLWGAEYGIGVQTGTEYFRTASAFCWFAGGTHNDEQYNPGTGGSELMRLGNQGGLHLSGAGSELSLRNRDSSATYIQTPANGERWVLYARNQNGSGRLYFWSGGDKASVDVAGNICATAFNPCSDRNAKENFSPIDSAAVLEKVADLPITRWNFKQDPSGTHIGPMAQDFYAAFGVGPDDKHIATVDADGVALAAIQALNQKLQEKEAAIKALQNRLERVEKLLAVMQDKSSD